MKVTSDAGTVELGTTEAGVSIGIVDFSRRVTDDYGTTTVVERGFARRMAARVVLPSDQVDTVQQLLAELRAEPVQWTADDRFAWLDFEGFYKDFEIDHAVPPHSYCTLTVESLTESETVSDEGGDPAPAGATSTLLLLQPTAIGDDELDASSVAENDHSEWSAETTYAQGARVIKAATHRVYESAGSGNVGHDPADGTGEWIEVGPTNRWAMFDEALGTATTASGSIAVTIDVGTADAVALLDVVADSVRVQTTGYDETMAVGAGAVTFLDLPGVDAPITVTVTGSGAVAVGTLLVGALVSLGATEGHPVSGINDFSRKDVDEFGEVTIVERAWAKRMSARAKIRTEAIDQVANRIAAVRARPSLWIGKDGIDSLTIYGFFKDFSIETGEPLSTLHLQIEGLAKAPPPGPPLTVDWVNVVDSDPVARPKPEDGATVGAPVGRPVGDRNAEDVTGAIDAHTGDLAQLDADMAAAESAIAAAESEIADLFDVYGDTASAAASAAAAEAAKELALDAKAAAEAAQGDSEAARDGALLAEQAAAAAEANAIAQASTASGAAVAATGSAAIAEAHSDDAETWAGVATAQNLSARLSAASLLPERYVTGDEQVFFANALGQGDPATVTPVAANATLEGFGAVYQATASGGGLQDWNHVGVLPASAGRVYQVYAEVEVTAVDTSGGTPTLRTWFRGLTAGFTSVAAFGGSLSVPVTATGTYLLPVDTKVSDTAAPGIVSWGAAVWLRPQVRVTANGGAATVQFKRLVAQDVTGETSAAAHAAAALSSEQAAAVHEDNAGASAAASDTHRVQAEAAAAASADAAQKALAVSMPERYVTGDETNFSQNGTGNPATMPTANDNATLAGWGPVYQVSPGSGVNVVWSQKNLLAALPGRIYEVEVEANVTAFTGSPVLSAMFIALDTSFAAVAGGFQQGQLPITSTGTKKVSVRVSDVANAGKAILAWPAGAIHERGMGQVTCPVGSTATVQFKACSVRDITSRVQSEIAAEAAATERVLAEAAATDAEAHASAAQLAETTAETHAGSSEAFSIASAQSAADAEGAKDQAILAQTATAASANEAGDQADAAAGFASLAGTQASNAGAQATAAQAAALEATVTTAATLPRDFAEGGKYWASGWTGAPTRSSLASAPQSWATFPTVSGIGKVLQVAADGSVARNVSQLGVMRYVEGRKYRASFRFRSLAGTQNVTGYLRPLSETYENITPVAVVATATTSWQTVTVELTGPAPAGTAFLRALMRTETGTGTVQWAWCVLEDVTDSKAAETSATASEASAVSADADAAAATAQANLAATYRTQAQTAQAAAENAEDGAVAAKNTATSQAGIATSAAATATAGASTATTQAGLSATHRAAAEAAEDAAVAAKNTATTQAGISTAQAAIATDKAAAADQSFTMTAEIAAGGINKNGTFASYPTTPGAPTGWAVSGATVTRVAGQISANAARITGAAATNSFMNQAMGSSAAPVCQSGQWWVLEADVRRIDPFYAAGMYLQVLDSDGAYVQQVLTCNFATTPDSSGAAVGVGVNGKTYRFTAMAQITHAQAARLSMSITPNHSVFGSTAIARVVDVHRFICRPATPAEIETKTTLPALSASVTSHASALATLDSQYATIEDEVTAQGLTVSQQQVAINGMAGRWAVAIDANGRVVGRVKLDGTGQTSSFDVEADAFRVSKPGGGERTEFSSGCWKVYDSSGNVRVKLGNLA